MGKIKIRVTIAKNWNSMTITNNNIIIRMIAQIKIRREIIGRGSHVRCSTGIHVP